MTKYDSPPAKALDQNVSKQRMTHSMPLSTRIVTTIADEAGVSSHELKPLYEVIDPEALNSLFAMTHKGKKRTAGWVEFEFSGYSVIAHSTGEVTVSPVDTSSEQ